MKFHELDDGADTPQIAHPFDLTYEQIAQHRRKYQCPKGGLKNAYPVPKAPLKDVFLSLSRKIHLHPDAWKHILRQLDQSTFQLEQQSLAEAANQAKSVVPRDVRHSRTFNRAQQGDIVLLASKIEFSDFLKAIQRESVLRDVLSEHQLYFHSTKRLFYQQDTKLITKGALEAIRLAKQGNRQAKIPMVTYLIDSLRMFTFQGIPMLLIAFENKSVQVFESQNGHYSHEFTFYDHVFDQLQYGGEKTDEREQSLEEQRRLEEQSLKTSGLTRAEMAYQERKTKRERGQYKPTVPDYTPLARKERAQDYQTILRDNKSRQQAKGLGDLELNTMARSPGTGNWQDQLTQLFSGGSPLAAQGHNDTILEEDEVSQSANLMAMQAGFGGHNRNQTSLERFEAQMREHSLRSKLDSNNEKRQCCKPMIKREFKDVQIDNLVRSKKNLQAQAARNSTFQFKKIDSLAGFDYQSQLNSVNTAVSSKAEQFQKTQMINLQTKNVDSDQNSVRVQMQQSHDDSKQLIDELEEGSSPSLQDQLNQSNNQVLRSLMGQHARIQEDPSKEQYADQAQDQLSGFDSNASPPPSPTKLTKQQEKLRQQKLQELVAQKELHRIKENPEQRGNRGAQLSGNVVSALKITLRAAVADSHMEASVQNARLRQQKFRKQDEEKQLKILNNVDDDMDLLERKKEVFAQQRNLSAAFPTKRAKLQSASPDKAAQARRTLRHETAGSTAAAAGKSQDTGNMTRKEQIAYFRTQRRQQNNNDREAMRHKRANTKPMQMYGVLGLDSLVPDTDRKVMAEQAKTSNDRAFGLDSKLFYPEHVRKDHKQGFHDILKDIDRQMDMREGPKRGKEGKTAKDLKAMKEEERRKDKERRENYMALSEQKTAEIKEEKVKKKIELKRCNEPREQIQARIDAMKDKKNVLQNRIRALRDKEDRVDEVLQRIDEQQSEQQRRLDFLLDKKTIADQTASAVKNKEMDQGASKYQKSVDPDGMESKGRSREMMLKKRQQRQSTNQPGTAKNNTISSPFDRLEIKEAKVREEQPRKKQMESKKTYPMCMEYYEPYNIALFALVSREIQIHQLKQTGVRRTFFPVQSLRVEHMIVQMSIEEHKIPGTLVLCLGTQSKHVENGGIGMESMQKSEVVVYQLDPKLEFEVIETYRWVWPEEQITSVYYKSGCGLILASFSGYMEIYDPVNITHSVWNNGRSQKRQLANNRKGNKQGGPGSKKGGGNRAGGGSISTVSYSEALDIIAFSGVSGRIYILDQTTKNQNGCIEAHKHEVVMLKFFDHQHQLISVSQIGEVGLWDAQKLTKIQILRNGPNMTQKVISTCHFYQPCGRVLMATTKIFNYDLEVDKEVKIGNEQQNAVARDYLRSFFKQLQHIGMIQDGGDTQSCHHGGVQEDLELEPEAAVGPRREPPAPPPKLGSMLSIPDYTKSDQKGDKSKEKALTKPALDRLERKTWFKGLTEKDFLLTAFDDGSMKDYMPAAKEFNGSVLASMNSKLIGSIIDPIGFVVYSIDSDLMIRVWDLGSGKCQRSYLIETRDDQIAEANQGGGGSGAKDNFGIKVQRKKAQIARSDDNKKFLIVGFEGGEVQVNDLYTGALIYNNATVDPIKIEFEIAQVKFFHSSTQFWIAASCWEGRVAFISRPQVSQGRNRLVCKRCKCSHSRDVITLDINSDNRLVTGSVDNVICFWNSFSGVESKKIKLPEDIASLQRGETIQYIRFPFKNKKDYVLVVINNGDCYILEAQSESFLEFNGNAKASDREQQQEIDMNSLDGGSDDDMLKDSRASQQGLGDDKSEGASPTSGREWGEGPEKQTSRTNSVVAPKHALRTSLAQKGSKGAQRAHKNPWILGRIADRDPVIDVQDEYLISVGENGKGYLHCLRFHEAKGYGPGSSGRPNEHSSYNRRQEANLQRGGEASIIASNRASSQNPIEFRELNRFRVTEKSLDPANAVFQVDLCLDHQIFLTSQLQGVITIFALPSCEILGCINRAEMFPPRSLMDVEIDGANVDNSSKKDARDRRHPKGQQKKNNELKGSEEKEKHPELGRPSFRISRQARTGAWHPRLRESLRQNADKYGSDIFQSVWDAHPAHSKAKDDCAGTHSNADISPSRFQSAKGQRQPLTGRSGGRKVHDSISMGKSSGVGRNKLNHKTIESATTNYQTLQQQQQ